MRSTLGLGISTTILVLFSLSGMANVHIEEAIDIGGIKQWIRIEGESEAKPVLLFLHGGPGNSAMSYASRFTGELRKHFLVVLWDQRETGKTMSMNASPVALTVAVFEQDAVDLIRYLCGRFNRDRIWLMGHSWGGFLGMTIAARHSELLEGYIAISPMIYQVESERLSLEWMKENARKSAKKQELEELEKVIIPFENGEQLYYHRKWLAISMGQKPAPRSYVEMWSKTWLGLFNEASGVNFFTEAPEILCPVYFLVGTRDYQTHFKLIEDYSNQVKANKKELFWFNKSGHLLNLTEPNKMQDIIIHQILTSPASN